MKASHATSEAPDPTFTHPHPVSSVEPEVLQKLENSILKPHGTTLPDVDGEAPDLSSIPEGLGYLKDVCGLDFGWGPTAMMEYLLEHIHITAGLSWSASIVGLAILIRLAIFPAAVGAAEQGARMREMQPILQPLREKVKVALRENNKQAAMETQQQIRELSKESGVSLRKAFVPVLMQIPLQFGGFRLLRDAGSLPVPAFETEQFLWVTDLSTGDATWILPVVTAGLTYLNIVSSQKAQPNVSGVMKTLQGVLPVVSFAFLSFQPAATQIFFFVNGVLSQIQISTIQNPLFRRWRNMTPLAFPPQSTPGGAAGSPSSSFSKMNIGRQAPDTPGTSPLGTTSDRSAVDKGVDAFKAEGRKVWKNTLGGIGETWKEQSEKKVNEAQVEKRKTATAKYEAQRRQDLEQERSYRNAGAVGPMRVDKNSQAPLAKGRERRS